MDITPPGYIKLNFDGSFIGSLAIGSFILTDWIGQLLKVGTCHYGTTSITIAEAGAMRDGIFMAIQVGFQRIIVKGDNKNYYSSCTRF